MKLILIFVLALGAVFSTEYVIDPAHSSAAFSVKHMMVSNVRGQFSSVTGKIKYDAKNLAASKVDASIDVSTVNTNQEKRDAHLKSADFFDVAKFPKMTFQSTKLYQEGGKLRMAGNLTIHGVTKPVVFDFAGPVSEMKSADGMRAGASAMTRISRKDFGLTWNRAIEAGGVAVGDEVEITLDIEANGGKQGS